MKKKINRWNLINLNEIGILFFPLEMYWFNPINGIKHDAIKAEPYVSCRDSLEHFYTAISSKKFFIHTNFAQM